MAKKDGDGDKPVVECPSVTATIKKVNTDMPREYVVCKTDLNSNSSRDSYNQTLYKHVNMGNGISSDSNEVDSTDLSAAHSTEHTPEVLRKRTKFQPNEKVTKVLMDSGAFDSINDAQVLIHRLRTLQIEKVALLVDHNNLIREYNERLKDIGKLHETTVMCEHKVQELRDLTCFLDDERKKFKKVAKEWRKFGQQTVHVLKNEVVTCREKLAESEYREKALAVENMELRDICVANLGQERYRMLFEKRDKESKNKLHLSERSQIQAMESDLKNGMLINGCDKIVPELTSSKHQTKHENKLLNLKAAQTELYNIQMLFHNDNRSGEETKVKFDFPEESDMSTTSDIDTIEYPLRLADGEEPKLGTVLSELNISDVDTSFKRVFPKPELLKKFHEENLSSDHLFFPSSPKKPASDIKVPRDTENENTKEEDSKETIDSDVSENSPSIFSNVIHSDTYASTMYV